MNRFEPFIFKSEEHEKLFIQKLGEVILETVDFPRDGQWHTVQITFDFCGPVDDKGPEVKPGGGFMLGGGHAG